LQKYFCKKPDQSREGWGHFSKYFLEKELLVKVGHREDLDIKELKAPSSKPGARNSVEAEVMRAPLVLVLVTYSERNVRAAPTSQAAPPMSNYDRAEGICNSSYVWAHLKIAISNFILHT
jgi:hypothetical protein